MKIRGYLIVVMLMIICRGYGQLISSSFPLVGTSKIYKASARYDAVPITTQTGFNFTWDFSQIERVTYDTLRYLTPAQAGYTGNFPGADIVQRRAPVGSNTSRFFYDENFLNNSSSVLAQQGAVAWAQGGIVELQYTRPVQLLKFPFAYNSFFRDTGILNAQTPGQNVGEPYDSVRLKRILYVTDSLDGFGNVSLKDYSFSNVYRNNAHYIFVDTMWSYQTGSGWFLGPTTVYDVRVLSWLANDTNFIIAEAEFIRDTLIRFMAIEPPMATHLDFQGLPTAAYNNNRPIASFQVVNKNNGTGQINSLFNDTVRIASTSDSMFVGGVTAVKAINGIAQFDSVILGSSANRARYFNLEAVSDTAISGIGTIEVVPLPTAIRFSGVSTAVAEYQDLPAFDVNVIGPGGVLDSLFMDTINIGKLDGPGNILGDTKVVTVNGHAVFGDIHFSYPGTYKLIGYNNKMHSADSVIIQVADVANINWSYSHEDTMSTFVDRAHQFIWNHNLEGFSSGTSKGNWTEISEKYDFNAHGQLKELWLYFALKELIDLGTDTFYVRIYNSGVQVKPDSFTYWSSLPNFCDHIPLQLLRSIPLTTDSIKTSSFANRIPTIVRIVPPLDLSSDFVVSLVTNTPTARDSIVLWTSEQGDGQGEHRTAKLLLDLHNNTEYDWMPDYIVTSASNFDLMITPIVSLDSVVIDTVYSTGTQYLNSENRAVIFPNPASSVVYVKASGPLNAGNCFRLYSLEGKEIQTAPMEKTGDSVLARFEISGLGAGVYIIKNCSPQQYAAYKLVIER